MMLAFLPIAGLSVAIGLLARSPAAGSLFLGYAVAALLWWRQRRSRNERQIVQIASLEAIAMAAADLRAGARPAALLLPDSDLHDRAEAAQRVSEWTGAGLAALFERMESQQRALSRVDSAAQAQAAGIRLTVLLLLLLPVGALLTGHAIGADPAQVLLHTEAGMICAATAFSLQLAGIAWSNRLAEPQKRQPHADLAFAADLIAAGLQAGVAVDRAILVTGDVLAGPLARQLRQVGHALRWGVASAAAWEQFIPPPRVRRFGAKLVAPPEARLVLAAKRSGDSGSALAGALSRCADDLRAEAAFDRQATMHRAGVLLVLPLGLCFLPAFLLSGLVPVVIAVLTQVI